MSKKSQEKKDPLTNKDALIELIMLSLPSAGGFIARRIVEVFNYGFAGRLESEEMIAGIGLGIVTTNMISISIGNGLSGALDTLCTQAFGNKNYYLAGVYFNRARVIVTLCFIPQAIILFFASDILIYIGQPESTSIIGGNYIRIVLPGVWTYCQTELLRRFLGAQGHFNIILKIQVITTMLHVLWLFLFVSVFEFGYQGIALSSCFTYILNFTFCMLYITYNKSLLKEGSLHWINKDSFTGLCEYMRFGGPSLLLLLFDMWCFQIMMIMAGYLGPIEMGACLVIINFAAIIFVLILGISMSTSKLVGNSLGANDPERARKYRDMAMVYAVLFSTIIIIFMLIFKNNLPYLMTDHQEIAEKVTEIIPIMVCWITADSLQGISAGIIRSMGIQIYATVFCLSINWGIILPLAYVFAFPLEMKAFGVWLSTPIGTILIAISYIWLIYRTNLEDLCKSIQERILREKQALQSKLEQLPIDDNSEG